MGYLGCHRRRRRFIRLRLHRRHRLHIPRWERLCHSSAPPPPSDRSKEGEKKVKEKKKIKKEKKRKKSLWNQRIKNKRAGCDEKELFRDSGKRQKKDVYTPNARLTGKTKA